LTAALTFFDRIHFPKKDHSFLESAQETIDMFFYLGGRVASPIEGLSKNGIPCLQSLPGETPHYAILALKISIFLAATAFATVTFIRYLTLSEVRITYHPGGITTTSCITSLQSVENCFQKIWYGGSLPIRAMRISSYVTYAMLSLKIVLRELFGSRYCLVQSNYDLNSAKKALEERVHLTPEIISRVKEVWEKGRGKTSGVTWFNDKVFKLDEYPGLVFKHSDDEQRFINMVVSQGV